MRAWWNLQFLGERRLHDALTVEPRFIHHAVRVAAPLSRFAGCHIRAPGKKVVIGKQVFADAAKALTVQPVKEEATA